MIWITWPYRDDYLKLKPCGLDLSAKILLSLLIYCVGSKYFPIVLDVANIRSPIRHYQVGLHRLLDIRRMKPDFWPDTGYQKRPDIWYNPTTKTIDEYWFPLEME